MNTEQKQQTETKQESLLTAVENYEPKKPTVADLEYFSLTEPTETRTSTTRDGKEYTFKVLIRGTKEYRVPYSVIGDIQELLKSKPNLTAFQVIKSGEGETTKYRTIPHITG